MERTRKKQEAVSMLVFKDHFASRHFEVPISWLNRLGYLSGILVLLLIIVSFLSVRYFKLYRESDSSHAQALEQELKFLKEKLVTLQSTTTPAEPQTTSDVPNTQLQNQPTLETVKAGDLSIQIDQPKAFFKNTTLHVNFNILYIKADNGNQQGHIIILAKGPSTIAAYPSGALSGALSSGQVPINSKNGEYFSVSRFRETLAEILVSKENVQSVEYFIFNSEGKIILNNTIPITKNQGPSKPAAIVPADPKSTP